MSDMAWNEAYTAHKLRAGRAVKRMYDRVEVLYAALPEHVRRVAGAFGPEWDAYQTAREAENARCERAVDRSMRRMRRELRILPPQHRSRGARA